MITKDEQMLIWHTKTLLAFTQLNFDNVLFSQHVEGTETYIKDKDLSDEPIDGFIAMKKHKGETTYTKYFITTDMAKKLPILIHNSRKIRWKGKIYQIVDDYQSVAFTPKKILNWNQLVNYSGIPNHSNSIHYRLYKNKVLYGRTKGQFYYRVITESAFGKDKYKEAVACLLNKCSNLSDPTVANLFYRACHHKDITINALPSVKAGEEFIKLCNQLIRIGDGTNKLDNRARSTEGTSDTAYIDRLTVSFTHNVPEYYHDKGHKSFDDIYPFNVISRYFYTLYEGFLKAKFPNHINYDDIAIKYSEFIKAWIKSAIWYEENWNTLGNKFPDFSLTKYTFPSNMPRFKDHFIDFARCLSHDAKDEEEYKLLLDTEYNSYMKFKNMLNPKGQQELVIEEERI